ncbi:hypothetical protein CC86DRAFT_146316 [Ophiobolus disseminans]|uniref:Uncharacterized protein n=1 Tax=Ophiobolus disseminans TaxID=1469910 RepID=A0A6A6ZEA6_9PLEO|nr:hypothetical protein CC86DRAFT_146316 [Ophiobolus disseminans]
MTPPKPSSLHPIRIPRPLHTRPNHPFNQPRHPILSISILSQQTHRANSQPSFTTKTRFQNINDRPVYRTHVQQEAYHMEHEITRDLGIVHRMETGRLEWLDEEVQDPRDSVDVCCAATWILLLCFWDILGALDQLQCEKIGILCLYVQVKHNTYRVLNTYSRPSSFSFE